MAINNMTDNDLGKVLTGDEQIRYNHEKYKDKFKDANADLVNAETFLNLLVAEMTNQDPLEPTSNTEFITQMAQFSQLQYLQDSSSYSMSNYASSLVGKTVTVSKMDGADKISTTGVVTEVKKVGDDFQIVVNGMDFKLSSVQSISDSGSVNKPNNNTNIGELIAKASSMIGLYAEASKKIKGENGETIKKTEGFIESVKVKDGTVNVVIGGEEYSLNDITEVYYATIVPDDPDKPDKPDGPDKPDDGTDTDKDDDKVDTDNTVDTDKKPDTEGSTDKTLKAQSAASAAEEMLHAVRHIEPESEGADLFDLNAEDINAEL